MKSYAILFFVTSVFLGLTTISLDAKFVPDSNGPLRDEASADFNSTADADLSEDYAVPIPRQEEAERPYEFVPRVFTSLRKIIRGVLGGNVHDLFHGSFSFAPREVSNELIGVYNQVVGLPDKTEKPYNATLEELLEQEFEEEEEEADKLFKH